MLLEIITIGDELLLGFTVDTNAAFLARELSAIGIEITRRSTVGDNAAEIAAAVRDALERTGAVITTGGLGPTADDLTKPAIAALFGREMELHQDIVAQLERRFRDYGFKSGMPAVNRQQALVPRGARVLDNRHGSAPGIFLEDERGRWVAMLPGVPRELRGMTADTLVPLLSARSGGVATVVRSRTLRCTGISESALAELLGGDARVIDGLPLAYLPSWQGVDLRLTARDMAAAEADELLGSAASKLLSRAGRYVYGEDSTDLAAVVLEMCRARRLRIAIAESCTGGMLGARLTAVPGSSDVFIGGVIVYDDRVKRELLGVCDEDFAEHGAVSEAVARRMAAGVLERLGSDVAMAITGIAGPGGGSREKPVGTVWIAAQVKGESRTFGRVFPGDRDEIRRRACQAALDFVRRMLSGE